MRALLERLRLFAKSRWPDPARTSLTWWLAAIHLSLVLLVAGGITWSASRMSVAVPAFQHSPMLGQ